MTNERLKHVFIPTNTNSTIYVSLDLECFLEDATGIRYFIVPMYTDVRDVNRFKQESTVNSFMIKHML